MRSQASIRRVARAWVELASDPLRRSDLPSPSEIDDRELRDEINRQIADLVLGDARAIIERDLPKLERLAREDPKRAFRVKRLALGLLFLLEEWQEIEALTAPPSREQVS